MTFDYRNAAKIFFRDRLKHESPNSAQTESVMAGALRIRLGGNAFYEGKLEKKQYLGDELKPVESEDIKKAISLMYLTSVFAVLIFSFLILVVCVLLFLPIIPKRVSYGCKKIKKFQKIFLSSFSSFRQVLPQGVPGPF